ncbi:porin [Calditrichota bacterium LG25]
MKILSATRCFFFIFLFFNIALADGVSRGSISGLAFGDYYYMFSNHNSEIEDMNGFWFRRIYLTYDQGLAENLSMRVRLEMGHPGDFSTKSAAVPFVKDAFLKYRFKQTQFLLGISSSPTFALIEKIWGYRSVEKTPADLYKLSGSRETGLAVKGAVGQNKRFFYHIMLGNGNGQKSETNKYKKGMAAAGINLSENILIEGYADYEQRSTDEKRWTYQGFAGFKSQSVRAGLQYLHQTRQYANQSDVGITLISAFFRANINNHWTTLLRVDKIFDKIPEGPDIDYLPISKQSPATVAIAGVDYLLGSNAHLIPNVEIVMYENDEINTDVMGRLTFYFTFK